MDEHHSGIRDLHIIRTRRRSFGLEIRADAALVLRAPLRASVEDINRVLDLKRAWIMAKQHKARERLALAPQRRFVEGQEFLYLGRSYPLRVVDHTRKLFEFSGKEFLIARHTLMHARYHFERWYIRQAKEYIGPKVHAYAQQAGQSYGDISITSAKTRWGSCTSKRTLNFSWRLMMAPLDKIDYVVAHEVAHLQELNHSKRFWDKVKSLMPDYKERAQWFKDNQHLFAL